HVRAPHALVVNAERAAEELRRARLSRRPIYHVPNAIEVNGNHAAPRAGGPLTVAFVGRLIPVKRLDLFLDALARARRAAPELTGVVIGDGPERAPMEERARTLGLADGGVRFLGLRDDVGTLLASADMLLLCS